MRSMRAVRGAPRTALMARNTKNISTQNATGRPQYNIRGMICGPTVRASAKWAIEIGDEDDDFARDVGPVVDGRRGQDAGGAHRRRAAAGAGRAGRARQGRR